MGKVSGLIGGAVASAALLTAFVRPGPLGAAEAVLAGGKSLAGRLKLEDGRLVFHPSGRHPALRLDQVHHVRLAFARVPPQRAAALFRATLADGSRLTGEMVGLDARSLRFRTGWARDLVVPRSGVISLTQLPGFLATFTDDLENGLKAWKTTGKVALSERQHVSGKHSLVLSAPGQTAEYVLADPLAAGSAAINFRDGESSAGCRWLVEAEFRGERGPRVVRVQVAGDAENYRIDVPGSDQQGFRAPRRPGWHRLRIEFAPTTLLVTVDEAALWATRMHGPGGPLHKVRLVCQALPEGGRPRGEVFFDDLGLACAVPPLRRQPADPRQDEIWLAGGDQLLGDLLRADSHAIEMKGRFGSRTWSWGEVRGLFFRQDRAAPLACDGEQVSLLLRSGAGPDPDQVIGQVRALDDERLMLRSPLLGDLEVGRKYVRQVRWLFHGRRITLDRAARHLGPKGKVAAGFQPARAEGESLHWTFRLEGVPPTARLRVDVVHLKGPGDGIAAALARGELRTEVVVNGRVVDYLNRHVERSSREPRPLTIALPRGVLRVGENTLRLRQTPAGKTRHYESCGITGLVLEMPR